MKITHVSHPLFITSLLMFSHQLMADTNGLAAGNLAYSIGTDVELRPCSERFTQIKMLTLNEQFTEELPVNVHVEKLKAFNTWGEQNLRVLPDEEDGLGLAVHVTYPKGSINPSNDSAPIGGAGYQVPIEAIGNISALEKICMSYEVKFQEGFDFALGGKLPGIYGGESASGCLAKKKRKGFSVRLMWRVEGMGEAYPYVLNTNEECGLSIGRGSWRFIPGQWTRLEMEVELNEPEQSNGRLAVWSDGHLVIHRTDLMYRKDDSTTIDGGFFSTFFGGSTKAWASPKNQKSYFRNLSLFIPEN